MLLVYSFASQFRCPSFTRNIELHPESSLPEIGRRFGGKHHSTVIHAIQKIDHKRTNEKEFDRLVESFIQLLH